MAVSLADRLRTLGKRFQIDDPEENYASFGAIMSATIFRNIGNTPKGSTPPYMSRSRISRIRTGVKLGTTLLNVKLRAQEWGFLSRSHHQTTSGPPESWNRSQHTKDRAFQCIPPLGWAGGVLQSIPNWFIMRLPYSNVPIGALSISWASCNILWCEFEIYPS